MKKRTLRTSVGIVAVAALVGMNLFHAWNNYGIKDSSMLLSVKATPADTTSAKCDTKPFAKTHYNALTKEKEGGYTTHCPLSEDVYFYKMIGHNRTLIGTKHYYYPKNESTYSPIGNYSVKDLLNCTDKEVHNQEIITYEGKEVDCYGYSKNSCCYESEVLNCSQVYQIVTK